jgi:hypothetical protein
LAVRDPLAAVPAVISALGNPSVTLLRGTLDRLPAGSLAAAGPGVISAMRTLATSAQKNQFRIEQKAQALELVADGSVLADVLAFYDANQASLTSPARAHLLAYVTRWDAKNGPPLLRKAVMADGRLVYQLSRSKPVPGLDQLCRERLFDADIDVAVASASALQTVGLASDRSLIEQRLTQWRQAVRARGADEGPADGYIEVALFMAATDGHAWRLTGPDWERLQAGCLTERCRAMKR